MSNNGRSLGCVTFQLPWDAPLVYDEDAHVPEGAEEEDLLREPFKEKFKVVFIVKGVQGFADNA